MLQVELFTAPIQKKEANEKLRMPAFLAKEVKSYPWCCQGLF